MQNYSISYIKTQITDNFTSIYRNASNFPSTPLYNECMKIICDVSDLRCIIFANDLGIPPVKSMLTILGNRGILKSDIAGIESQSLGSLMGFLFKQVFKYQNQKDRLTVKMYGVRTATLFMNVEDFQILED
ncbi:MAG: hypothetical protein MR384_03160 [Lachnospiraceae bacterium]|nr:hypothetical protein [Lachnospiraceae bacterium]